MKFNTPWNVIAPKGMKFLMTAVAYTDTYECNYIYSYTCNYTYTYNCSYTYASTRNYKYNI